MSASTKKLAFYKRIPALADSAVLRYFTFTILYFAQGVPSGVMYLAFPAWMAANGKTPMEVGSYLAVVMFPWSFKIIAAPLMDRFTYLPMGRRKPWLLLGQAGLVGGFIFLALVNDPLEHMNALMVAGFMLGCFGIIQDISIDSMAIELLPEDQQARANGLMWGSQIFGKALTVAVCTYLINQVGYQMSILIFASVILMIMMVPIFLKERKGEKRLPWTKGQIAAEAAEIQSHNWFALFKNVLRVFVLPVSLFVALSNFFFSTGEGLMNAVLPVFTTQELGWMDSKYANIYSSASMISGVLAMFIGGPIIDYFGKKRMMILYIFILILLVSSLLLLQNNWHQTWLITTFFITFYTFNVFTVVTIFAMAMNVTWRRVAATQFTLYMTVGNLGLSLGAWLMGALKSILSWEMVILCYIPLALTGMFFTWLINFKKQKASVHQLEKAFHEAPSK